MLGKRRTAELGPQLLCFSKLWGAEEGKALEIDVVGFGCAKSAGWEKDIQVWTPG